MGICELMTTSASDSNAVSDKTKHDQAKPPRHCICARFKDTRHKCAYDFEDLGIIGELITMLSLILWQLVSFKGHKNTGACWFLLVVFGLVQHSVGI